MTQSKEGTPKDLRDEARTLLVVDYFVALGVTRTASADQVQTAFVNAAKTWHPDRIPKGMEDARPMFEKVFARLDFARGTLQDPARRAKYIEELLTPPKVATEADVDAAEAKVEFHKAHVFLRKQDNKGAEVHLRRALELDPNNIEGQVQLVWLSAKPESTPQQLTKLIYELDRWISQKATDQAHFYRGQLHKRLGKAAEANADFVRAAQLNPRNVEAAREVRIHAMRQEKAVLAEATKKEALGERAASFFKKLVNR
jgi:curved DNA-binding protein CbpA